MPGPKSSPQSVEAYRDDILKARRKAKPNRKAAARLDARISQYTDVDSKRTAHGFDMHKPGSQNRKK